MRYWWVNQKQTWRHELAGGYLWSPKRNTNEARNQFYENMKEVAPGDLVFSYVEGHLIAWGLARSFGYDAPKPLEFGEAGHYWSKIGYRVDVEYHRVATPVRPRDHFAEIRPLLPSRYSPLHAETGKGLQSVYLAALPRELGETLARLLNRGLSQLAVADARAALASSFEERERTIWEAHVEGELEHAVPDSTTRDALIKARRGQGLFRKNVAAVERACRVTRVQNPAYLIASHIKPWRHGTNEERLDAHNGLMLAPQVDFLFDRGFISFGEGRVLISPVSDERTLLKLGIDPERPPEVGGFDRRQESFLEFHRREVFRKAS